MSNDCYILKFRAYLRRTCLLALTAALTAALHAGEPAAARPLVPVRLALQWLPQSQFAGFYMARDRGFYRAAGLDVTLLHTGPGPSSLDFLADQRADFATLFLADAIVHARHPVELAHVAQLVQRSQLMLVAWKDMGIEYPSDLDGQLVSFWPGAFSAAFNAFFRQHDIRPRIRRQHYSVNLFLHRGVAACAAMAYNEFHRIYQAGVDYEHLTVFLLRDYGLGFPEDGIYTSVDMARNRPDLCRALREATLAGWEYARQHPEEALDAVLSESRRGGVPANRPHSRWMLEHILAAIFPPDGDMEPGRLDPRAYQETAAVLQAAGLVESVPAFEVFAPPDREPAP